MNEGPQYNPYAGLVALPVESQWFELDSPIPQTIEDPRELMDYISATSIIPAYGTTERSSHTFLIYLSGLLKLSPSFNSAISDINSYSFGLNFELVEPTFPGLAINPEREPIDYGAQVEYANMMAEQGLNLMKLLNASRVLHRHLRSCGNAYIRLFRSEVAGVRRYAFSIPHFHQVAYVRSQDPPYEFAIFTRDWDIGYLTKYPPTPVRVTRLGDEELQWTNVGGGISETIIHLKREIGSDWSEYYGRTEILSVYDWLAADVFGAEVISKIAATEIIAKNIFAFQGPNPNAIREANDDSEFMDRIDKIRQLTTSQGSRKQVKSMAAFEYPWGSDAPIKLTLDVARDTDFAQFTQDYAANTIYSALNWSTQLSGFREVRTGLGSNVLRDLLITKQVSTIEPIQREFESLWNWMSNLVLDEAGFTGERYALTYKNTVDTMIEKLNDGPMERSSPQNTILNDPVG